MQLVRSQECQSCSSRTSQLGRGVECVRMRACKGACSPCLRNRGEPELSPVLSVINRRPSRSLALSPSWSSPLSPAGCCETFCVDLPYPGEAYLSAVLHRWECAKRRRTLMDDLEQDRWERLLRWLSEQHGMDIGEDAFHVEAREVAGMSAGRSPRDGS